MESFDEEGASQASLPSDFDQIGLSKWGLDWGDVSLIRWKLSLTPTERLRTAQSFVDTASKLRNAKPAQVRRDPRGSDPV